MVSGLVRAPKKLTAALAENAGLKKQLAELTETVATAKTSKLVIHSANYAAWSGQGKRYDVTRFLRHIIAGDSLVFGPIENGRFWIGDENLVPNDPLERKPKRLEVTYSYDGEQLKTIQRAEGSRLTLPEDSAVDWLGAELKNAKAEIDQLKAAQPKPSQYPIPPLRLKILAAVSELEGFMSQFGEEPEIKDIDQHYAEVLPWRDKVVAAYRLTFDDQIPKLRDEIVHRTGQRNDALDGALLTLARDLGYNAPLIKSVITKLGEIALQVRV